MSRRLLIEKLDLLLAMIIAIGPLSTDMYLPAFPAMSAELHGGAASAPLTLAAWFGGIALGQLVHGPLSDRFGRKAPLQLGTALYVGASVGCALASSMPVLVAFRALAAFGGAAGLVIHRAIIRDVAASGDEAARIVSRLQLIVSVVPMLAPSAGGFIVQTAGWRTIFWVAAAYGLLCLLVAQQQLRETRPPGNRSGESLEALAPDYWAVLRDRGFTAHVLTGSFATLSLFAFLGGAPAVFLLHYGMTPTQFGLMLAANGAAYALGTWLNVTAIRRFGLSLTLSLSAGGLLCGAALMLLCAVGDIGGLWGIEGPMIFMTLVLGCLLPDAGIGAIGPHRRHAGIASALYGAIIFAIGALGTIGVGLVGTAAAIPMAAVVVLGAALAWASSLLRPVPKWPS